MIKVSFSCRMYSDSGGDGKFPVSGTHTTQGGKEPHAHHFTLDTETPTPRTHPQSQRRLKFIATAVGVRHPNLRTAIGSCDPIQDGIASNAARMDKLTKKAVNIHDDPHVGPGGAVGLSEKFPDSDKGSTRAKQSYTSDDDDDQGKQGSRSEQVNCTNQNDDKDKGSNVATCQIKKSETEEDKGAGEPADFSLATISSGSLGSDEDVGGAREAIDDGSLGSDEDVGGAREAIDDGSLGSDENVGGAREAIDDGMNGEMVFPVMRLPGKDVVMVVSQLHSWDGGVEKSELVI